MALVRPSFLNIGSKSVKAVRVIIFRRKIFFERKIFNSVVDGLFLFLKLPMTRRVQVRRVVGDLYNTCVGCHPGSEAGGGGFESRY